VPVRGIGTDVGTPPVKDSMVLRPGDMIAVGDVRSDAAVINFNANLDPVIDDAADNLAVTDIVKLPATGTITARIFCLPKDMLKAPNGVR
jgi:hypothetical protein